MTEPTDNNPDVTTAEPSGDYLLDSFVSTRPGEPFRLFPFGTVIKNGKKRNVTPELARRFKLPHFQPPIKLGSHKEETPAGGHMLRLEVRETGNPKIDGLWVYPEYNDKGTTAVTEGHYKYESPEVFWDGDTFEDPKTGEIIQGPLVVGAALLHTPHLGHEAALYSIQPNGADNHEEITTMAEQSVNVPVPLFDRFMAWIDRNGNQEPEQPRQPSRQPEPTTQPEPEQFTALKSQLTEMQAQLKESNDRAEQLAAENARQTRLTTLSATIANVEHFGSTFAGDAARTAAEHLDSMDETTRDWTLQQFRSLSAVAKQGAGNLQKEIGNEGSDEGSRFDTVAEELNAAVAEQMREHKVDYNAAYAMVQKTNPELVMRFGREVHNG